MPDLHYEHPALAELYDLDSGWSIDRDFYLGLAAGGPKRILDLGCGTGLLCDAYAALGHRVTGVDPAKAMLEVAKAKPCGSQVDWVESAAQTFRSDARFDLIIMTGNAFQVFLEDDDILAVFTTMREHLAEGGVIAFETRNPAIDWPARWDKDAELTSGERTVYQSRRIVKKHGNRVSFETRFQFPDKDLTSFSELLFLSKPDIEARLATSGLKPKAVYGDWTGQPFDEATSEYMVFIVEAA
ncbi:MAG: methyltransferase [Proteobacteria bacterium]|nr:methyltransferase [Pseudomonadota bacterium]